MYMLAHIYSIRRFARTCMGMYVLKEVIDTLTRRYKGAHVRTIVRASSTVRFVCLGNYAYSVYTAMCEFIK